MTSDGDTDGEYLYRCGLAVYPAAWITAVDVKLFLKGYIQMMYIVNR